MFTGIVEAVGGVVAVAPAGVDTRLHLATGRIDPAGLALGESIAASGVCLTVAAISEQGFWADCSAETLGCTTLGEAVPGTPVNLERSVTPATRMGGHLVSGHVDGVGTVAELRPDGRSLRLAIDAPAALARYLADKGSVCVDGVSLTVNAVDGARFELNIVPYTLAETTLSEYRVGRRVNLEVDVVARYLERLLAARGA